MLRNLLIATAALAFLASPTTAKPITITPSTSASVPSIDSTNIDQFISLQNQYKNYSANMTPNDLYSNPLYTSAVPLSLTDFTSYDKTIGRRMLNYAGASYCSDNQLSSWVCSFCKAEGGFELGQIIHNENTNMRAIVGIQPNGDGATSDPFIVIAIKGTDDFRNLITDLTFAKTAPYSMCSGCGVHDGFANGWASIRDDTVAAVKTLIASNPGMKIIATGHSMGAALAELAVMDLSLNEGIVVDAFYSYGNPRVGNAAYATYMTSTMDAQGTGVYRVVHYADPVPHLGPEILGFQHGPEEIWYNEFENSYESCERTAGEDQSCSDSMPLSVLLSDHLTYIGVNFIVEFLKCKL